MRALVVTNTFPPVATGGYERTCADVVRRWRSAGHTVDVLTGRADVPHERGVQRRLAPRRARPPWRAWRTEWANDRAVREALATRPDVVSVWNLGRSSLGVLARVAQAGIPMVLVVCDGWLAAAPAEDPWMARWLRHPRAGRVVGALTGLPTVVPDLAEIGSCAWVSDAVRSATATTGPPWAPRRGVVTGSGIDEDTFPVLGDDEPQPSHETAWNGRLLFVGRLAAAKGVDDAIAALSHLSPDTTLAVIGPGDPARLRSLMTGADALGVSERTEWSVAERCALPARYSTADAVLFPSRWAEPFGLVPLEAMACGTPVVATGTGGSSTFLRHEENCLLVPPARPDLLAGAVRRLAAEPALRRRLVAGGRRTAASHGVGDLARRLWDWHVAHVAHVAHVGEVAHAEARRAGDRAGGDDTASYTSSTRRASSSHS